MDDGLNVSTPSEIKPQYPNHPIAGGALESKTQHVQRRGALPRDSQPFS